MLFLVDLDDGVDFPYEPEASSKAHSSCRQRERFLFDNVPLTVLYNVYLPVRTKKSKVMMNV